jgi:hypothetical protein
MATLLECSEAKLPAMRILSWAKAAEAANTSETNTTAQARDEPTFMKFSLLFPNRRKTHERRAPPPHDR